MKPLFIRLRGRRGIAGLVFIATALLIAGRTAHGQFGGTCGCPVIVSDIPEHREFLSETSAVLVPAEDPKALAHAIEAVLQDGHAARRRAELATEQLGDLSVEAITDAYARVYQQVLKGASS